MSCSHMAQESGNLLVGNEPCTFVEVRDVLMANSDEKRWPKLLEVATSLDIPTDTVYALKTRIPLEMTTYSGGLHEILEAWRQKTAENAKLNTLIKAFETNGLKESADVLRIRFKVFDDNFLAEKLKKYKEWKDFPEYLKSWANGKIVMFQGKQVKLEVLTKQVSSPLDKSILEELVKGEMPCIVNTQVPEKHKYYIHRTVKGRNQLKLNVLQNDHKDVFVIKGIQKHKLSSLVKGMTDMSGNQLKKLTVRFILLQHESDFEKICKLAGTRPVHWIKYKGDAFELIISSGSVENLQKFIDETQDSFLEDELAFSSKRVCLISDSPGMGKTYLLASIAHQIMKLNDNMVIRFIVLNEFVQALIKKKIGIESMVQVIAEQSSKYEFGKKLVEDSLRAQPCVLLFDGFAEVLPDQVPHAKQILQIATTLPLAKIFVATRPHFRDELENTLHVLSYTIQPFSK